MKLYVWETDKKYESMLSFAIAKDKEEAKKIITREVGYPYKYPNNIPEFLNEYCCMYDLDEPIAFYMSHSG